MSKISKYVLDEIDEKSKKNTFCKSCKTNFVFMPDECWFDEQGFGYSTKLTKCPNCGKIVVVKCTEDYGFSRMNNDSRYF